MHSNTAHSTVALGRPAFLRSWLPRAADTRSARRRLMAVLRNAFRVLGLSRRRSGLGYLTATSVAVATSTGFLLALPSTALAGTCINGNVIDTTNTGGANPSVCSGTGIAVGSGSAGALSTGTFSIAIGHNANAPNQDSTAIGRNSVAQAGAVALGLRTNANHNDTVAIGTDAQAMSAFDVAVGSGANASGGNSVALGLSSSASGPNSLAFGNNSSAQGLDSIAIGRNAVSSTNGGIAIGFESSAGNNGVAVGLGAAATASNSVAFGTGATVSAVDAMALGLNANAAHANAVALGSGSVTAAAVATTETVIDGTTYTFAGIAPASTVSIGAPGAERTLTNVAAGRLSATSTDAVNGSQLFATNQAVDALGVRFGGLGSSMETILGGGAAFNPDGTMSPPTYIVGGGSYSNIGDAFGAVDSNLTVINNQLGDIAAGAGITYFRANSSLPDAQATGADSIAIGPEAVSGGASSFAGGHGASAGGDNSVALGHQASAAGAASVAIGEGASATEANSVALGAGSTTDPVVGTTSTQINGTTYQFAGGAPVGTVSVGSAGAERTITHVAAGRLSADSTDAVNGSQLYATNQAVESVIAGVGELNEFAVQYDRNSDGTRANSVTLQGGDPNAPVLLANVARGTADNHAVNVGQLNEGLEDTLNQSMSYTDNRTAFAIETANNYTDQVAATTLNQANAYTDRRLSQLNADISGVRSEARQAAAIGLAAASLRFDDRPGKLSVAVGGGLWQSEGALAFGFGYTSQTQRLRTNLTATTAGGNWGVGAGLSVTLN